MTQLFALPQTTVAPGTFSTGNLTLPVSSFSSITVTFNVNALDLADVTKTLTLRVQVQQPDNSFKDDTVLTWAGGSIGKNGTLVAPQLTTLIERLSGAVIKIQLEVPTGIRTGLTVTAN